MSTGDIEVIANEVKILNKCRSSLPFPITGHHRVRINYYISEHLTESKLCLKKETNDKFNIMDLLIKCNFLG